MPDLEIWDNEPFPQSVLKASASERTVGEDDASSPGIHFIPIMALNFPDPNQSEQRNNKFIAWSSNSVSSEEQIKLIDFMRTQSRSQARYIPDQMSRSSASWVTN